MVGGFAALPEVVARRRSSSHTAKKFCCSMWRLQGVQAWQIRDADSRHRQFQRSPNRAVPHRVSRHVLPLSRPCPVKCPSGKAAPEQAPRRNEMAQGGRLHHVIILEVLVWQLTSADDLRYETAYVCGISVAEALNRWRAPGPASRYDIRLVRKMS